MKFWTECKIFDSNGCYPSARIGSDGIHYAAGWSMVNHSDDRPDPRDSSRISPETSSPKRPARFLYGERSSLDPRANSADYLANANLFRRSYVRTIGESEGMPLDSTVAWFVGNNVAFYKLTSNSCVEAKRTEADAAADKIDGVVFDYVLSGEYSEETATGFVSLRAGDLGMVQSTVEVTARSRLARIATIFLPRTRLAAALETDLSGEPFILRSLSSTPLAPFVGAQMRLLFESYGRMDAQDFEIVLEATAELLIHVLGGELSRGEQFQARPSKEFMRAIAYIEENYHRPELTPDDIWRGINVSRTQLYKLFSENSLTVAGYLRDVRLRRFVDALRTTDASGIGRLAWTCGLDMQAADFTRLFKRVYGMTPRQARAALQAGQPVVTKVFPAPSDIEEGGK
ncbi:MULTISPECIES: helix-turn-helix domain-containing protein [unclassified Bradyrhizobium]